MTLCRRQVLRALGIAPAFALRPARRAPRSRTDARDEVARRLLDAPRDRVLDVVRPLLAAGLSWHELEAAIFVAGIREVGPRPLGNKLHAVLATESVFQLMETGEPGPAVLWSLDALKEAQERDVRQGGWSLGPPPRVTLASTDAAVRELHAAFAAADPERADHAVVALATHAGRVRTLEALWPYTIRDFTGIGHGLIFAVHIDRTVSRVGEAEFEAAVRSLVYGLLSLEASDSRAELAAARELAPALRADWSAGERDPERSLELARGLRTDDPAAARVRLVELSKQGADEDTLWDGLRLAAADLFVRRPGLLTVHATTVTNALFHWRGRALAEETRRQALLMGASWLPLFRERFRRSRGVTMREPGLDPLLAAQGPLHDPRPHLFRAVREAHEVKFAAAVLEDARHAHPRFRAALQAAGRGYWSGPATPLSPLGERVESFLGR